MGANPEHVSAHVSGGRGRHWALDAAACLSEHGAEYGLSQIYSNEPWHYELLAPKPAHVVDLLGITCLGTGQASAAQGTFLSALPNGSPRRDHRVVFIPGWAFIGRSGRRCPGGARTPPSCRGTDSRRRRVALSTLKDGSAAGRRSCRPSCVQRETRFRRGRDPPLGRPRQRRGWPRRDSSRRARAYKWPV